MKVGDKIRDNDPRMNGRVLTIERIWHPMSMALPSKLVCRDGIGRVRYIQLKLVHSDGKARRSGFDLIPALSGSPEGLGRVND